MSGLVPVRAPTSGLYLTQQTERLRLAVKQIVSEFQQIDRRMKEVQNDLMLVISALDEIEGERSQLEVGR